MLLYNHIAIRVEDRIYRESEFLPTIHLGHGRRDNTSNTTLANESDLNGEERASVVTSYSELQVARTLLCVDERGSPIKRVPRWV